VFPRHIADMLRAGKVIEKFQKSKMLAKELQPTF